MSTRAGLADVFGLVGTLVVQQRDAARLASHGFEGRKKGTPAARHASSKPVLACAAAKRAGGVAPRGAAVSFARSAAEALDAAAKSLR